MIRNIKSILILTGSASVIFNPLASFASANSPCDTTFNKNAVHCAFIGNTAPQMTGKYLKVKEVLPGRPAFTKIFCAVSGSFPVMNIPQNLAGAYHSGDKITWQFSQCLDEDCSASQMLVDDKFTISKTGNVVTSGPKNQVEVQLDPGYGLDCKAAQQPHPVGASFSVLQAQIDDTVSLLNYIPQEIDAVINDLNQMQTLAQQASEGTFSSSQLGNLDAQFQLLMSDMDRVQHISTLAGVKQLGGGSLNLTQNVWGSYGWALGINAPVTDVDMLGVRNTDLLTVSDSQNAYVAVENAFAQIYNGRSVKK